MSGEGADVGDPMAGERLQKFLARLGFGSRRTCEEMITAGRVTRNGIRAELGNRVGARDTVTVDGIPVPTAPDLVYYLLNKPTGVVSTASDPQGRRTVTDLVPATPRVYPAGRLDFDTEGLLLLTNDGELTQRLTHPSFGVDKEYLADVEGIPDRSALRALRDGVELEDGRSAPARVQVVQRRPDGSGAALSLVIHEGRNRQVRRMCDTVGHRVVRLARVRIGSVADRSLAPGAWRPLSLAEVRALYRDSEPESTNDGGRARGNASGRRRPPG